LWTVPPRGAWALTKLSHLSEIDGRRSCWLLLGHDGACVNCADEILSFPPIGVAPIERESDLRPFGKLRRGQVQPMHSQVRVGRANIRSGPPLVGAPMNERRSQYFDSQRLALRNPAAFVVEAPHGDRRTDVINEVSL